MKKKNTFGSKKKKNPAAVALGRRGGKKRAKNLSKQELSEGGRLAAEVRWKDHKKPS